VGIRVVKDHLPSDSEVAFVLGLSSIFMTTLTDLKTRFSANLVKLRYQNWFNTRSIKSTNLNKTGLFATTFHIMAWWSCLYYINFSP
jgi:hypothetical protein